MARRRPDPADRDDVDRIRNTLGSKRWRMNNLYSVVNKAAERVQFRPNVVQRHILEHPSDRSTILKSRQVGVTTIGVLDFLDDVLWTRDLTACILAHEKDGIEKIFRAARRAYNFLPPELKPRLDRGGGSKYEMFFPELNSRIYCDLESRGDTINRLHVSEAAFFKDPMRMKSTLQAVPIVGGRVRIETTPNGMGNHYYDLWTDPDGTYAKLFYPWFIFPEYQIESPRLEPTFEEREFIAAAKARYGVVITNGQLAFRRFKKAELKAEFIQEYPEDDISCFLVSGAAAMNLMTIKKLFDEAPEPIELHDNDATKIYRKPEGRGLFVIGADTAEGDGGDFSVGSIWEATKMEQVAQIRARVKPFEFAGLLAKWGREYTARKWPAMLAVERNNHGHAVILELEEHIRYQNMYRHTDEKIGWLTDRVTRPIMIDAWIDAIENGTAKPKDRTTLGECLTLVQEDGKIEAADGKHDDCVIAGAIAIQMCIRESGTAAMYANIGDKIKV